MANESSIGHQLRLFRRSLPRFVVDQFGEIALPLFMEGWETTCTTLYLLPTTVNGLVRDALTVVAQTCVEVKASLAPLGW